MKNYSAWTTTFSVGEITKSLDGVANSSGRAMGCNNFLFFYWFESGNISDSIGITTELITGA